MAHDYGSWKRQDLERCFDQQRKRLEAIERAYGRLHAIVTLAEKADGDADETVVGWARDVALTLLVDLGDEIFRRAADDAPLPASAEV